MDDNTFQYILKHQHEWAAIYNRERAVRKLEKNRAEKQRAKDALIYFRENRKIY
jgi:hypothetical protein